MDDINDETPIYGKYKTIGEIKTIPIRSSIQVISKMKPGPKNDYLCKWLYETHYQKIKFTGNLTDRIRIISNKACYNYIISKCFDGIDPLNICITNPVLNDKCLSIIKSLHEISPSTNGTFMDYLMRRIISEIKEETFNDSRATRYTSPIIKIDKKLWQFIASDEVGESAIFEEPDIKSRMIYFKDKDRFIELERKNEWLKIEYKKFVVWVRYLVPDVKDTSGIAGDINDYVPNKWFNQIDNSDDNHYCESGCKMEQINFYSDDNCVFPYCQNMCYVKAQDTKKYKTKDILQELYIVSCCHAEAFGGCPRQDNFNQILNTINELCTLEFIEPMVLLCKTLLVDCKNILLNPALGGEGLIPSDCDLVIDDNLIDIKCTSGNKDISEILQLLGYSSLLKNNEKYNIRINNVCILNLLQGEYKVYNIENITDNNLLKYLELLTKDDKINNKNIKDGTTSGIIDFKPVLIERSFPPKKDMIKKYPVRYNIEKFNEMNENSKLQGDYKKWKNGINYTTGYKIKIDGKTHKQLKEKFIIKDGFRSMLFEDLTKIEELSSQSLRYVYLQETKRIYNEIDSLNSPVKIYNAMVDDFSEKIKNLKKWTDFIEFEGKNYGIPAHLYKYYPL